MCQPDYCRISPSLALQICIYCILRILPWPPIPSTFTQLKELLYHLTLSTRQNFIQDMPLFGITFSSVGDIIAITQLAIQIKSALSDTRGAPREYQDLIAELDLFHRDLLRVHSAIPTVCKNPRNNHQQFPHPSGESLDIVNALHYHISLAEHHMKSFIQTIEKYQISLQKGGSKNMMLDTWRKLGWTFLKKEVVQNLNADLSNQRASIVFLLTIYNSYVRIPCPCSLLWV